MWRSAVRGKPSNGGIKALYWVNTLDGKIGADGENVSPGFSATIKDQKIVKKLSSLWA